VATAWLAVQTTTRAIQQEQGQSLSDDKSVYDALLGYAATHPTGPASAPRRRRARKLGRRITLMTEDRQVIADSSPGPSLRTPAPSATVDPLRVDLGLTGGTDASTRARSGRTGSAGTRGGRARSWWRPSGRRPVRARRRPKDATGTCQAVAAPS
jgi:hypothetical protein